MSRSETLFQAPARYLNRVSRGVFRIGELKIARAVDGSKLQTLQLSFTFEPAYVRHSEYELDRCSTFL